MLNMLTNSFKAYSNAGSALIAEIDDENTKNQLFYKEIENWRNIETTYINKISQLATNLKDKNHRIVPKQSVSYSQTNEKIQHKQEQLRPFCASIEFSKLLNVIIDSHKSLMSKVNFDIVMVNLENSQKLIQVNKKLLDEERQLLKDILSKKEMVQKIFGKKEKLRKQKQEEEMCQIFMSDSIDITIDQKMRKKTKIKEVEKELQESHIKIKEIIEDYRKLYQQEKEQLLKIKYNCKQQTRGKRQTLLKMHLHLTTYWKNLNFQVQQLKIAQDEENPCYHQQLFSRMEKKQEEIIKKLGCDKIGFVENSLRLINQNLIDQLIQYTKDKDIKNKIKRIMETNEVDPAQTDQSCRQVKLIKKILAMENVQCECMNIFRGIVNKTAKLRLNFVFIMQFFRINNQFQIAGQLMYSLFCLISEFLEACYESRDSFALKQLMILLMTYYVSHPNPNGQNTKIYIIHFFKKHPLWRDIQYWESILIQCIYLQKRNTIKMMIISEYGNLHRKKELFEAQRSAILNQMLIVVRNMIIFQYTQKEVKSFASRFIKLLKQDQKFQKDVNSTIEQAVKQQSKLLQQQKNEIKNFYKLTFIRQKQQQYNISTNIHNSYIQ